MHLNDPSSKETAPICSMWLAEAVQAALLRLNATRQHLQWSSEPHGKHHVPGLSSRKGK